MGFVSPADAEINPISSLTHGILGRRLGIPRPINQPKNVVLAAQWLADLSVPISIDDLIAEFDLSREEVEQALALSKAFRICRRAFG